MSLAKVAEHIASTTTTLSDLHKAESECNAVGVWVNDPWNLEVVIDLGGGWRTAVERPRQPLAVHSNTTELLF